jgi:hypothetical protein
VRATTTAYNRCRVRMRAVTARILRIMVRHQQEEAEE